MDPLDSAWKGTTFMKVYVNILIYLLGGTALSHIAMAWSAAVDHVPIQSGSLNAERVAEVIGGATLVGDIKISPDGQWVAYHVKRRSVEENAVKEQWLVQPVKRGENIREAVIPLPEGAQGVQWRPGTPALSLILPAVSAIEPNGKSLMLFDLVTRKLSPVLQQQPDETTGESRSYSLVVSENYSWSPQGRYVAFIAPASQDSQKTYEGLDTHRGVPIKKLKRAGAGNSMKRLFVLDTITNAITPLTSMGVNISAACDFDWSPDERSLVVTIDRDIDSVGTDTDLIVVDRASGKVRDLVVRPGMDCNPTWSPDGRWIAFSTQHGKPDYYGGWPAAVSAVGGKIISFPKATKAIRRTKHEWLADSSGFLYQIGWQMGTYLVRADLVTREISNPLPLPAGSLQLPFDDGRSFSRNARRIAYVRSAIDAPPELFVSDLDRLGRPIGAARQLTMLNADFPLQRQVRIEQLNWPSPDGKFIVHGLLVTPISAWRGSSIIKPLPTLLHLTGGPGMVPRGFAGDGWNEARLPLAALGYAVLVPNTRGRGGYEDEFLFGINSSKSYARLPFADAMAGVDELIRRGIADPQRLGVMGHSYGGFLTEYAITQTNRFKAAVVHEAHVVDLMNFYYPYEAGSWRALLARELFGVHDPFDSAERARLVAESPGLNGERIKTPTMLTFGAASSADRVGRPFHSVLRYYKVPSAFFVYDEGHVFARPAAIADHLTRTIEWLDHWVRGKPYPNAERAKEYEQWKEAVKIGTK